MINAIYSICIMIVCGIIGYLIGKDAGYKYAISEINQELKKNK